MSTTLMKRVERKEFFEELNKKCGEDGCKLENNQLNTAPIYINGEHIGGFNELYKHFKPT